MKNLQQIKSEKEASVSNLLESCGVFFAFSNEQFNEGKTPLQEGEKYVSMGAGGYMPKGKVDTYLKGIKEINKQFKKDIAESKELRYAHIAYELNNHEAYYTMDIENTLSALGEDYKAKEVQAVFNKESAKHINY